MLIPESKQAGHMLEELLLGDTPVRYFHPDSKGNNVRDKIIWDERNLKAAIDEVREQIDHAEKMARTATVKDVARWNDVTTSPKMEYSKELYNEFCRLAGLNAGTGCGIKHYNSSSSVLDWMGADFFLEVNPMKLPADKFGNLRQLMDFIYLTGDVTLNEDKAKYKKFFKADSLLFFERIPLDPGEQIALAKKDAIKMVKALIDVIQKTLGRTYNPPLRAEIERLENPEVTAMKTSPQKVTQVRETVKKRAKRQLPPLDEKAL